MPITWSSPYAPVDAEYIVDSADSRLPNSDVLYTLTQTVLSAGCPLTIPTVGGSVVATIDYNGFAAVGQTVQVNDVGASNIMHATVSGLGVGTVTLTALGASGDAAAGTVLSPGSVLALSTVGGVQKGYVDTIAFASLRISGSTTTFTLSRPPSGSVTFIGVLSAADASGKRGFLPIPNAELTSISGATGVLSFAMTAGQSLEVRYIA